MTTDQKKAVTLLLSLRKKLAKEGENQSMRSPNFHAQQILTSAVTHLYGGKMTGSSVQKYTGTFQKDI